MCAICQLPLVHQTELRFVANYIDPGSGYVFGSGVSAIFAALAAFFGSTLFFLRNRITPFFSRHKKKLVLLIIGIAIIGGTIGFISRKQMSKATDQKVIVLAVDAMDPNILEEGVRRGLLPNFSKLKESGYYSELQTTVPPQSPVVWASFITGKDPAEHRLYDFIKRNPSNYQLDLVFNDRSQPFTSTPFWELTARRDIPTTVLFLPDTYPPAKLSGKMLSGMGVPDVLGTEGTYALFTSRDIKLDPKFRGRLIKVDPWLKDQPSKTIHAAIQGPKYKVLREEKTAQIPIEIKRNGQARGIEISVQNQKVSLSEKEFSGWVSLQFDIDFFNKVRGIARFYLKGISPDFELYLSPINFDPRSPVHPISYPKEYSGEIARHYGLYPTQGLPYDTWALEEGIFDEETFLRNADSIFNKRREIILGELRKQNTGLFIAYFGAIDIIQHMFWRFLDDPESSYQNTILDYYKKIDNVVGEVQKQLSEKDTLIVLSDHGFASYDYEMNVNRWLLENGYLVLKDNKAEGGPLLSDIDWSKTKAYSIGYNGIYFNLKGREGQGVVEPKAIEKLEQELSEKLLKLKNPEAKSAVVKKVYAREDLGIEREDTNSPDLFMGYYKGTRSSWDTAIGGVPKKVFVKRVSKWAGDHLFDPSEVPGVILSNKKIEGISKNPKIEEVMPVVLEIIQ